MDIKKELLSFFPDPIIFIVSWILKLIGTFRLQANIFLVQFWNIPYNNYEIRWAILQRK